MAAHRDGFPVRWTARQRLEPHQHRIHFTHVRGISRGMDVTWFLDEDGPLVHVRIEHDLTWRGWPIGPWIATVDEVPDARNLRITTMVNDEVRQKGSTVDMVFDCPQIVAFLSRVMTLRPGTIITTGTPAGVGFGRRPPVFLCVGDKVTVDISGVGRLVNQVIGE